MTAPKNVTVKTSTLLGLVHVGQKYAEPRVTDAADSVRSLVALHLKHERIVVKGPMVGHYNTLRDLIVD